MVLFYPKLRHFTSCIILILAGCTQEIPEKLATVYNDLPEKIDFNFHIKPILSDRCYSCHGPDEGARKANLRLDTYEGAFQLLSNGDKAFIAGKPHKSQAIKRMLSDDPEIRMPPPESNLTLTPTEIATIRKWVDQGAEWKAHWSFIPPIKPDVPGQTNPDWKVNNEIDLFIHRKMVENELTPSRRSDKERLLRRVYLDLTGLPPSVEDIDIFMEDKTPDGYEKVVDKLLNDQAFGERMALNWMDLARYADSHGLHADGWRSMWPWRDWVINAFNNNMPFDKFVKQQLAGDLLPQATKDQILATAFNRNHPMTAEGGAIDEEFRLEYVADRTNTVATALLGMTMECARCHDHKFDPITQEEYYQLSAFFNNVNELGMTGDDGNFGPSMYITKHETDSIIAFFDTLIKKERTRLTALKPPQKADNHDIDHLSQSSLNKGLIGNFSFDQTFPFKNKDGNQQYGFDSKKTVRTNEKPKLVSGKKGKGVAFKSGYDEVYLDNIDVFEIEDAFTVSAWIHPSTVEMGKTQQIIGNSGNKNQDWRGWDFFIDDALHLNARLIHKLPTDLAHIVSAQTIPLNKWTHVAFRFKGNSAIEDLDLFINGEKLDQAIRSGKIERSIHPIGPPDYTPDKRPLVVGKAYQAFTGNNGIFVGGAIDEIKIYERALSELEIQTIHNPDFTSAEPRLWQEYHWLNQPEYNNRRNRIADVALQKRQLMDTLTEVMVITEMKIPRKTFILNRGAYDQPTEQVFPATPAKILPFDENLPKNRLGLAEWLFDKRNPLTARVAVNRYWQLFQGRGLVKTLEDFGSQGSLPTHPELLDWLAVNFRESDYDIKALCKLIVMSATYQQSSKFREELNEKDPENIYLAKAPSYRLQAEFIRDIALHSSGLLYNKIGGKSAKPYQPEGLWIEKGNFSHKLLHYKQDKGKNLYRRSLYTFIRRTSPPPFFSTFDAPSRDRCTLNREITNTPLQALLLLNDPQFVEAAKMIAQRVQLHGQYNLNEQIILTFRMVTSRTPDVEEISILQSLFNEQMKHYKTHPKEAKQLLAVGESLIEPKLDPIYTAALTMVSSAVLNHDEMYMKR